MIRSEHFLEILRREGIDFFSGVPDSLLKQVCACITEKIDASKNIIAANEGAAIGLAAGYHLATNKIPLVYMQNSGLGNATNPLLSLADPDVYQIPMLLMIGWRGEPGVKDEPQHVKQGKIQIDMLRTMDVPYEIICNETVELEKVVSRLITKAKEESRPVALVVKKGTFAPFDAPQKNIDQKIDLIREEAITSIVERMGAKDIVVSTTGKTSRELFEVRAKNKMGHDKDFLTVGSMGHCSQIALGVAMQQPTRNVYCFDGDGAVIMHMGSLAIIGSIAPENFKHVVFNNGAHDSVGGQPTVGFCINLPMIATASGYKAAKRVKNQHELNAGLDWLAKTKGPAMLEIWVKKGARKDLGRPTRTPVENKKDFMNNLNG